MNEFDATGTLDALTDAFFAVDANWRFTFVNRAAAGIWKRSPETLMGRVMWEEFPSLLGSPFEAAYRDAAARNEPVALNSKAEHDGRWYELRIFPRRPGLVAFYRDTTELQKAEGSLERMSAESDRQRRTYQNILAAAADMHYVMDTSGRFVFANESLLKLWNRKTHEVIGLTLSEIGHAPEIAARFAEHVAQIVAQRVSIRDETPFEGGFGGRTFEYILSPVLDADGNVEAITGASRDISARRAYEIALQDEARRKDEFIATLAHELRNPLAPIRNALEVARLAKGNDVAVEYAHGVMERQMTHMVRLIDDLLDMSRLNLGKIALKTSVVELGSVLESAIETARPHIERAGHAMELIVPDQSLCIDCDATRLTQVFANLLNNAAKFTAQNGRVWVTATREGDCAVVRVKDNGIGMTEEMLEHVFDMFTQESDALNRTEGGLGIGLTLAKGLVHLHGGTIRATSEGKGLGSEFIVCLPLSKSADGVGRSSTKRPGASTANRLRIVVVDDNADSATSLSMMLNFMGHDTRTANNGAAGLEIAESFRPDVCLLDIGMPNLNGYELAKCIRGEPWGSQVRLIALSGWGQEHDQERSRSAGFDMHFVKPIDPGSLSRALSAPRRAKV